MVDAWAGPGHPSSPDPPCLPSLFKWPCHGWDLPCWLPTLWSFNRGVGPHLVWRHTSQLSSQAVKIESGFLSSSHWELWLSLEVPQGCHTSHRVWSRYLEWQSSQFRGIRCTWSGLGHRCLNYVKTPGVSQEFQVETASSWGAKGMLGFLSQRSREMDPPLGRRRRNHSSS